jgi:hypothetical protein
VAALALLAGLASTVFGTSAIHQILTAVYFLIFAVCIGATGIMAELRTQMKKS